MGKRLMVAAVVLLVGVVLIRLLAPDMAGEVKEKLLNGFGRDGRAAEVFENLTNRLALHISAPEQTQAPLMTASPLTAEVSALHTIRYTVEDGITSGEIEPIEVTEPPLPEAVTAFLESQAAFADYELPEKVDYTYVQLPFDFAVPVSGYNSSGFGYRLHPILNTVRFHYGTDFAANAGTAIYAFADGTVSFAGYCDSYGNYVKIDHGDGWETLYAHCSKLYVSSGQSISQGDKLALVGSTGMATGPHLHFELCCDGIYYNPEYYVNQK